MILSAKIILLLLVPFSLIATGQTVSLGVIGGISPGDDYRSQIPVQFREGPPRNTIGYPIGLSLDVSLKSGFSVEVDGLYRQQHFSDGPSSVVTWQVPVLAKYRFTLGSVKPFIEAGPSFRATGNLNSADPAHYGGTVGAGLTLRAGRFKIEPTVRYTHWARRRFSLDEREVPNRLEFLIGVSTAAGGGSNWRPFGHRLSVGAVGGLTLTKDYRSQTNQVIFGTSGVPSTVVSGSGPQSFIAGPTFEIEVKHGLSVEVDGIYRPLRDSFYAVSVPPGEPFASRYLTPQVGKYVTWEFPILAKYRFPTGKVRPLVEFGPAFRTPHQRTLSPFGLTAGVGAEAKWGIVRIAPVLRFSHWGQDSLHGFGNVHRNEAVALVGFSF